MKFPKKTYSKVKGSFPRIPRNMDEMFMHLSGRHEDKVRDPVNREEERDYTKVWRKKGKGYNKPPKNRSKIKLKRKQGKEGRKSNRK